MKTYLILFFLIAFGLIAQGQQTVPSISITGLPTKIIRPASGWVLIDVSGVSYKMDVNLVAYNKLDTAYISNDSFYTIKNGVKRAQKFSVGSTGTVTGVGNMFEDAFTGLTNSYNLGHQPVVGTVKVFINGVKIPAEAYSVTSNNVLLNTSALSFTLSSADRIDITYNSTFQTGT